MPRKKRLFNKLEITPLRFLPFLFNHLEMRQCDIFRDLGFDRQYISAMLNHGRFTRVEEVFSLGKRLKMTDERMIQILMLYILSVRKMEKEE